MKVKKLNGKSNVLGKNVKKYRELKHQPKENYLIK